MSDNRELKIHDFLNGRKVEHLLVLNEKEVLINDDTPKLAIDIEVGKKLSTKATLYAKEKELLYGSLFLLGEQIVLGKTTKVCAPLLLFPASIKEKQGNYFVSIDNVNARVNNSAIEILCDTVNQNFSTVEVLENFPSFPFDYGNIGQVSRHLKQFFPDLNVEATLLFPELWDEKKIKRNLQPKQRVAFKNFKLIPASMLGLVQKSNNTFGILSELEQLEKATHFSAPLNFLFKGQKSTSKQFKYAPKLPTVLNKSQQNVIFNAQNEVLSMIVGPPGTGKSYTIACIALDHMMRGESVLISSKQDEAVNVVAEKLRTLSDSEKYYVRGGASGNLRKVKAQINALLHQKMNGNKNEYAQYLQRYHLNELYHAEAQKKLETAIEREIKWAKKVENPTFLNNITIRLIGLLTKFYAPHWQLLTELENKSSSLLSLSKELIKKAYEQNTVLILTRHRAALQNLFQAFRARRSSERDSLFKELNYKILLNAFPIWLCKLSEQHRILPQRKELFDLVIIDEASQCDIATSLAAMQRGKRVVICGDPNQLRHVSFLSAQQINAFAAAYEIPEKERQLLNFRENSILDFVSGKINNQKQVSFLEEHYRSSPAIIQFSNEHFYSNALRIMNDRPKAHVNKVLHEVYVRGKRLSNGSNLLEAEEIIKRIKTIVIEQSPLKHALKSSIGILSPLAAQCDLLSTLVSEQLSLEAIQLHNISVGTAYSFQGEERDIMFLSMVVDDKSHHSAFVHLNKPDVFNVSITRAKGAQYLIHSLDITKLKTDHYLRMYIEMMRKNEAEKEPTEIRMDIFMEDVTNFLQKEGLQFWMYFSVAGVPIDILVQTISGMKGIDLIGLMGQFEAALSVNRLKLLTRSGISMFPMPFSFWQHKRDACEKALIEFLK